ncbi:MAG: LytR/AlgR family response regulator transcription factor [Bryobacteraceae bacterium]
MRAFLVDDEQLALKRLSRLLAATGRIEVAGTSTDPVTAVQTILNEKPELLFLDIEMPGLNGFEMLAQIDPQPLVIFTTAYDQYALRAFGVNSVDYLLKPVEARQLDRALQKIDRIREGTLPRPQIWNRLEFPERIASRVGERIEFVDLAAVTHFFANEKLTFASTPAKTYTVDYTIQQLEQKLDPRKFARVHRSTIVNLSYVQELHTWFAGRWLIRLKDDKHTEITVARDRARSLKDKLGM